MKANVLMYKSNGNDLKTVNQELEKVIDHVYYYIKDGYYSIIFEYKGVYFHAATQQHESDLQLITSELYQKWIDNSLSDSAVLNPDQYIRKLEIEILRLSGSDPEFISRITENRLAYIKKQEEKEMIRREEYAKRESERKEMEAKEVIEQIEKAEINYKEGKRITSDMFIKLCDKYGVKIPIATKGRLLNEGKTGDVSNYGYCQPKTYKGKRLQHFSGYFKVMNELNERIA